MKTIRTLCLALTCGALALPAARAELKLGSPFSDHMVVQHDKPLTIWGWDEPGQEIEVTLGEVTAEATAADDGRWQAEIAVPESEGPHEVKVAGSTTTTLEDVLVGEVWLASGQSNMGWQVKKSTGAKETIKNSANPRIRFFVVPQSSKDEPQSTVEGKWEVASPATTGEFSGVAYFFAKRLEAELDRPIGILQSAWGGSKIQAWIPADVMASQPDTEELRAAHEKRTKEYQAEFAAWEKGGKKGPAPKAEGGGPQHGVSLLDNGMIQPLLPYPIKGAIWYQGESDSWNAARYREQFALLVNSWRDRFGDADLPVYFAQLPNFNNNAWANFRYHQTLTPGELPNTDYAVLIDAGTVDDIHPPDKKTPGHRLAQLALAETYGKDIVPGGPKPVEPVKRKDSALVVKFENVGGGLELKSTDKTSPFVLFFADESKEPVTPTVEGNDTLVFPIPADREPTQLVYANFGNPPAVLYNQEGFPGTPFRLEVK